MTQSIAGKLCIILVGATLAAFTAANAGADDSGFLKDYSQLEVKGDRLGVDRRVWMSDKLTPQNYKNILMDPVAFYPQPQPSGQVTLGTLNDIRDYIDSGLRKAIEKTAPPAKAAGPGVVRLRVAITAASVDKGLKPYQLIPIAFLFTAAKRAGGTADYNIKLFVESEMTDSVTGEVLSQVVREAEGIEVKGDEPLVLKLAQPQLDKWLEAAQQEIDARFKPAGN